MSIFATDNKPTERLFFDRRREIDPQSSPRGRAFELWKNAPMPKVTITKTFNIGRLVTMGRRRGLKTNMLMCWCIGHAASPVAEIYTLPAGGRLWQYDRLAINTVVMTAKGEPHLCDIPFSEDIRQFNEDYIRLTRQVHDTNEDHLLGEQYMAIDTSALSLCEIDSVVSVYSEMFTNPFLAWGKYRRGFFKTTLPVSFQFHHAVEEPLRMIVECCGCRTCRGNAGLEGSVVVNEVKNGKADYGYNARTEKYEWYACRT